MNPVSDICDNLGKTVKSIIKICLQSRIPDIRKTEYNSQKPLYILANGPSLRETIDKYSEKLKNSDTLAVNFAANAPEFKILKPKYYVLADPHFFKSTDDYNVAKLIDNIKSADWDMTLFVNRSYKDIVKKLDLPQNVRLDTFNAVGTEGFKLFERLVYKSGLGMPRPRNVLIPSIMVGIWLGYKTIYLCGADHSWMRDIRVTEDNEVVSGMNHFYKESDKEIRRARNEYKSFRLHDIVLSYYTAFSSYHRIADFARKEGVDIINATPGSYIDAFRRSELKF